MSCVHSDTPLCGLIGYQFNNRVLRVTQATRRATMVLASCLLKLSCAAVERMQALKVRRELLSTVALVIPAHMAWHAHADGRARSY